MPQPREYLCGLRSQDWVRTKTILRLRHDGTFERVTRHYRVNASLDGLPTLPSMDRYSGFERRYYDAAQTELVALNEIQIWHDLHDLYIQTLQAIQTPTAEVLFIISLLQRTVKFDLPSDGLVMELHSNEKAFQQIVDWQRPVR